ncbi:MAG: NUDIX hydrolase [Anaerolineae bacterium]|nr:NUDIX hydrolase [Anaerolineae bacterium]
MPDIPITTLHSEVIWSSPWYRLRQDQIRLPNGEDGVYTVVDRYAGAVFIVPQLPDGQIVLIRNYRHTVQEWLWEVPAGGIQHGDSPEATALRELAEEVGGTTDRLTRIGHFYTMPGVSNEICHVFVAHDVNLGEPAHEVTEVMERHVMSLDAVLHMVQEGLIADAPSALSIMRALPVLRQRGDNPA